MKKILIYNCYLTDMRTPLTMFPSSSTVSPFTPLSAVVSKANMAG